MAGQQAVMTTGVTFSEESARRIGRAVRDVEDIRRRGASTPSARPRPTFDVAQGGLRHVVVRSKDWTSDSPTVIVTPVRRDIDDGTILYSLERDADGVLIEQEILCDPDLRRAHYAPFAEPNIVELTPRTNILKAYKIGTKWHLEQRVRWDWPFRDSRFQLLGCLPVVIE